MKVIQNIKNSIRLIGIITIFSLLILNPNTPNNSSALPIVLESDILTTVGGTNFTVAYTRESDIWSYNESNTFKLSIGVIEFGSDVINLNSIWFGYRFRNETTGFNYESWSKAIGRASPLQPYWEDRVSLDPSKVADVPSQLKMTVALKFVENFISKGDEEWSMMWTDVITITLIPNIPGIEVTDPAMFWTISYTETEIVTSTATITEVDPNEWVAPYLQSYPHDMIIDMNQTTGKALPYSLEWTIYGSSTSGNWGNVTLDGNPNWKVEAPWTPGSLISIDAVGPALNKGYHTFELSATDSRGYSIMHEVYVSVVNMTGFAIDNPEIVSSLSEEYGGAPPGLPVPVPITPLLIGLGIMVIAIRKRRNN